MSFARGRHAATISTPRPHNDRREHLNELRAAVEARPGIGCGLVERRGVTWLDLGSPRRTFAIGCDFRDGAWWFVRSADGTAIAPADDITGAVKAIERELGGVGG
ncbi:hypothetical protein [Actinomadura rugatobispora]|uniref:Uncharacterized protein n=1 Tax=Actinomadura rugatobispora TaxID=1994 RepID=A0ABW0ZWK9_9ACTN|nr:hypothetical protein GCM10010200_027400 [Actinomadura rugatobispora]